MEIKYALFALQNECYMQNYHKQSVKDIILGKSSVFTIRLFTN